MPQWAVKGDPSNGGGGQLKSTVGTVFASGKLVVTHGSAAAPDDGSMGPHSVPSTKGKSSNVFAEGKPAHRIKDARVCGHKTVVKGNKTVYVNG